MFVQLSEYRTVGISNCRSIELSEKRPGPVTLALNFTLIEVLSSIYELKTLLFLLNRSLVDNGICIMNKLTCVNIIYYLLLLYVLRYLQPDSLLLCYVINNLNRVTLGKFKEYNNDKFTCV